VLRLRAGYSLLKSRRERLDFLRENAVIGSNEAHVAVGTDELKMERQPVLLRRNKHRLLLRSPEIFGGRNAEEAKAIIAAFPSMANLSLSSWQSDMQSGSGYVSSVVSRSTPSTHSSPSFEADDRESPLSYETEQSSPQPRGNSRSPERRGLWRRFCDLFSWHAQRPPLESEYWRKRR